MKMNRILAVGATLLLGFALSGCGSNKKSSSQLPLNVEKSTVTLSKDGTADVNFTTAKNAKYKVLDKDNKNAQVGDTYTTKTGNATLTLNSAGHYRLEVKKNSIVKDKDFVIKSTSVAKSDDASSEESSSDSSATLAFGKSEMLKNGDSIVEITVNSVDQVSADDSMVVDISSNESDKKQFVIVSYTIKAIKGTLTTDDFDGSNLSIADSQNSVGSTSSNRDNGTPDELKTGQSIKLRIGAGFEHTGDKATVSFGNSTWSGSITK